MSEDDDPIEGQFRFFDRSESDYLYGIPANTAACCVCGRTDSLLVPMGDELACVECCRSEGGETKEDEDE